MNREKYQALCEEFPFLSRYLSPDWVCEVGVKLPEPELLEHRSSFTIAGAFLCAKQKGAGEECFTVLNLAGDELYSLGGSKWRALLNPMSSWFIGSSQFSKVTVGQAVEFVRLCGHAPHFVLKVTHQSFNSFDVTVYRPRKGRTFLETIEEIR